MPIIILQLLFFSVFCAFTSFAQQAISSLDVSESLLKQHVFVLASDSLQGRQTGTAGQLKAAKYCAQQLKENHLQPAFPIDSTQSSFWQRYYFINERFMPVLPNNATLIGSYQRMSLVPPPSANDSLRRYVAHNIGGLLLGTTRPQETVVISAHFDHLGQANQQIFHGADDNASGTAAVLAIAATFDSLAKAGIRPQRSILFVLFSGEEGGLIGSTYFIQNTPVGLDKFVANLNIDMIGRTDKWHRRKPNYCYLITGGKKNPHREVVMSANAASVGLEIETVFDTQNDVKQYFYRSDHYNFAKNNIPIAFFFDGEHPDYHQPSDTAEKIDYALLQKRATLIFQVAWQVANPSR